MQSELSWGWSKLYKLDNKGKIREWSVFIRNLDGTGDGWEYVQKYGVLGGKLQEKATLVPNGKNEGKANATNAFQQCIAQAQSVWKKQRDRKGYSETIPTEKPFGPMLAQRYDQHGHKIKFPCLVQPKLDGLRCIADANTLLSRQNKEFTVLQHIKDELAFITPNINQSLMAQMGLTKDTLKFDGELYIHDKEFQSIVGAIKRDSSNELTSSMEYHIYDVVDETKPYSWRWTFLLHSIQKYQEAYPEGKVKLVPTYQAESEEDVARLHDKIVAMGYEGIMLRNIDGMYLINGRSYDLQKVKSFDEEEFTIIDTLENEKSPGTPTFVCLTNDGVAFKVTPEGSQEHREALFRQRSELAGKQLTVAFFGWTTPKKEDIGKPDPDYADLADYLMIDIVKGPRPRFPVGKAIRGDY